jgi:hypothetical protein
MVDNIYWTYLRIFYLNYEKRKRKKKHNCIDSSSTISFQLRVPTTPSASLSNVTKNKPVEGYDKMLMDEIDKIANQRPSIISYHVSVNNILEVEQIPLFQLNVAKTSAEQGHYQILSFYRPPAIFS